MNLTIEGNGTLLLEHDDGEREVLDAVAVGNVDLHHHGEVVEFYPVGDDIEKTLTQARQLFRILVGREGKLNTFELESGSRW